MNSFFSTCSCFWKVDRGMILGWSIWITPIKNESNMPFRKSIYITSGHIFETNRHIGIYQQPRELVGDIRQSIRVNRYDQTHSNREIAIIHGSMLFLITVTLSNFNHFRSLHFTSLLLTFSACSVNPITQHFRFSTSYSKYIYFKVFIPKRSKIK